MKCERYMQRLSHGTYRGGCRKERESDRQGGRERGSEREGVRWKERGEVRLRVAKPTKPPRMD